MLDPITIEMAQTLVCAKHPEGVASVSPGLPYSATLGDGVAQRGVGRSLQPQTGLRTSSRHHYAALHRFVNDSNRERRNPVGVGANTMSRPKVAEYDNLGLRDAIPLGLFSNVRTPDAD